MIIIATYDELMEGRKGASRFQPYRKQVTPVWLTSFTMYSVSECYPVVVPSENKNDMISVELHLYDNETQVVDMMKRRHGSLFEFTQLDCIEQINGTEYKPYMFLFTGSVEDKTYVTSGSWWLYKKEQLQKHYKKNKFRSVRK